MSCQRPWASRMPLSEGEECARVTWLKTWAVDAPVLASFVLPSFLTRLIRIHLQIPRDGFQLGIVLPLHGFFVMVASYSVLVLGQLDVLEAVDVEVKVFAACSDVADEHGTRKPIVVF
jgi:hypothetical protein